MDLELSDDHVELRETAVGTLDRHAPLSLARAYLDGAGDAAELWSQLAALGWFGIGLDEDDPFGIPGLCLLAHQVGRRAAPTTLVDTAVLARVAMAAGGPAAAWHQRLVDGEQTASLAMLEPSADWGANNLATVAHRDAEGVVVSGIKTGVHHAGAVGVMGVVTLLDDMPAVLMVSPSASGVQTTAVDCIDPACAPARVTLSDVRVDVADVLAGPAVVAALHHALDVGAVATAAEGIGAASAALDLAIAYALEREQYGRPIGGFQALRHLIADQHHLRETAWASVLYASAALEERLAGAEGAVAVAKAHAATAARQVAEGALQVFGGVGFTREHDLHLLYRRAIECERRFGDGPAHERRIADDLLAGEMARSAPGR